MRRIALTIQYLGAHYSGWQLQPNKVTVQGEVETALARILQSDVRLHCAGRTDGGVNATGMVAHFDTVKDINLSKLCMGADLYLPSDISVVGAVEVPINFDARFSAISKTYVYRMYVSSYREPLLDINHLQIYKQPDIVKMQIVADKLIGERDFSAFSSTGSNIKGTVRKLSSVAVEQNGKVITVTVSGNAFLYNMVRIIVGTLLWVGLDKIPIESIDDLLEEHNRRLLGKTLPPRGLTLERVYYDEKFGL